MDRNNLFSNLFIFEMANNHMGEVEHGLKIIRELHSRCEKFENFKFAFKFQYRDLDTFIHPDYMERTDYPYIKRFTETNLSAAEKKLFKDEAKKLGFLTMCTPFDESSVDLIEEHDYDIIKVASCSFTDWPLLERIAKTDKPIIASTAGASLKDIDRVESFLSHRDKDFCLMHCVGEYPTERKNLQLDQIDLLKDRYPEIQIGYSTHESPDNVDAVKIAIGKGASVFERHVGVKTDKYNINGYSSQPEQISAWLEAAQDAIEMCGVSEIRFDGTEKEKAALKGLRRGLFAKTGIKKGEEISLSDTFSAMPSLDGQVVVNNMSKYSEFIADTDIEPNQPVMLGEVTMTNLRDQVLQVVRQVSEQLIEAKVALPNKLEMEISHHYGMDAFSKWGATIINCINREYCKKLIVLLPGQSHPIHLHKKKEETFHVLSGSMSVSLNGVKRECKTGDMVVVEREVKHDFSSQEGVIFEEISTTHYKNDSFYDDEKVSNNRNRKTALTFWSDWLYKQLS